MMPSNPGFRTLLMALSFAAAGAALAQDDAAKPATDDAPAAAAESCFSLRQARSMTALDDNHVFVETTANRNFLLTATTTCPGLRGALGIAIRSREGDRVCSGALASVTYRQPGSNAPTSCNVNKIVGVADKAEAEAISKTEK